jgi:hypothetical protein
MPFRRNQTAFIVIPGGAGPGESRIVITSQLPPPLDTYTFTAPNGTSPAKYASGIIYYPNSVAPNIDQNFNFECTVENLGGPASGADVHHGRVQNGAVVEVAVGEPAVTSLSLIGGVYDAVLWNNLHQFIVQAYEDPLSGIPGSINLLAHAPSSAFIDGGASLTLNAAQGPVSINSQNGGDVTVNSADDINFNAAGEIQVQTAKAYLLTHDQTNRANANLVLVAGAAGTEVLVPGCSITLNAVTADFMYDVIIVCDMLESVAGATNAIGSLYIDGVLQTGLAIMGMAVAGDRATITQVYSGTIASGGNHTFQLRARTDVAAGTVTALATHTSIKVKYYQSGG